jgi:aspartate 1-decarboxylase
MATCTAAHPEYMGSITIDEDLLDQSGMRVNDAVLVADCRNGNRFETYIFKGERGSRKIEVNGAAAHLVEAGDQLIVIHFAHVDEDEYRSFRPTVLLMNEDNSVKDVIRYEPG